MTIHYPSCCRDVKSCCGEVTQSKTVHLDVYYLDDSVCDRCVNTLSTLDQANTLLDPLLEAMGIRLVVNRTRIDSLERARRHRFISSPTVRVNGIDVMQDITENPCSQCGSLCGDSVTCRTFTYQGKTTSDMPLGLILEAVLRACLLPVQAPTNLPYTVPENLTRFFKAR